MHKACLHECRCVLSGNAAGALRDGLKEPQGGGFTGGSNELSSSDKAMKPADSPPVGAQHSRFEKLLSSHPAECMPFKA